MAKIKVLHFIHSLVSGGAEKQLHLLSEGMDKENHEVAIFCVNDKGHSITDPEVKIFTHYYANLLQPAFIRSIYQCLKQFDPDVVHVWLPQSVSIPAMILSRLLGKKVIFSYRMRMSFQRPLVYPEFLTALLFSHRIISNRDVQDSLWPFRVLYRLKKGTVIENAVLVPEAFKASIHPEQAPARFLFVGRLTHLKNLSTLVAALGRVNHFRPWKLDVFGVGEEQRSIEQLIEANGLQDKVFLQGSSNEIYRHMAEADALIFPSISEGMPNVLVEALEIGLPVLASDISANRAVVGNENAVIWIDPLSQADIAEKVEQFLSNEFDTREMVETGRRIASRFTLEAMVSQYETSYRNMVG